MWLFSPELLLLPPSWAPLLYICQPLPLDPDVVVKVPPAVLGTLTCSEHPPYPLADAPLSLYLLHQPGDPEAVYICRYWNLCHLCLRSIASVLNNFSLYIIDPGKYLESCIHTFDRWVSLYIIFILNNRSQWSFKMANINNCHFKLFTIGFPQWLNSFTLITGMWTRYEKMWCQISVWIYSTHLTLAISPKFWWLTFSKCYH